MNYLEVKYEEQSISIDSDDFISKVISAQNTLGQKQKHNQFEHEKLNALGFDYNTSTKGYCMKKEFSLKELEFLAKEVEKLENHSLNHGYITLKYYDGKLYFWDRALIYEGVDTFEYCLKHHNHFKLGELNVITKSNSLNEELLNLAGYTKRYSQPSLEYITQDCVWDKKEGLKILKGFVKDINEYMKISEVKE